MKRKLQDHGILDTIQMHPIVAAKNIDKHLDKFAHQMDKYWKSGAMKHSIINSNQKFGSKLIIEPTHAKKEGLKT